MSATHLIAVDAAPTPFNCESQPALPPSEAPTARPGTIPSTTADFSCVTPVEVTPVTSATPSSLAKPGRTGLNARPVASGLGSTFLEPVSLTTLPLGPSGDRRTIRKIEQGENDPASVPLTFVLLSPTEGEWRLPYPGGVMAYARPLDASAPPSALAVDVYVALLVELTRAGFPPDGRVRLSRYGMLQMLLWMDSKGRVSGRHYAQLEAALEHLMQVKIRSKEVSLLVDLDPGTTGDGEFRFRILQGYGVISKVGADDDDVYARHDAGYHADDLVVDFTTNFVRLLQHRDKCVHHQLSHYLAFRPGIPRALYRYVVGLGAAPLDEGKAIRDLDDLLAACGSVLRNARPSQAKTLFRDTFEVLVERGFLRTVPQFISGRRANRQVVQVVFEPRTPPSPGLRALLTATLTRWGVIAATASKLVAESTEWTATVVAAVMLGMLEVRKTLPSMVVNYCQHPGRAEEFLIGEMPRFDGGMGRETATANPAMKYLESGHDHAVAFREGLTRDQLAEYQESFRAIGRPEWVVEGLVLAALARNTTSLREYLRYNS